MINLKYFIRGMGFVMNIFGNYYSESNEIQKAREIYSNKNLSSKEKDKRLFILDKKAIASDWRTIGKNLSDVLDKVEI